MHFDIIDMPSASTAVRATVKRMVRHTVMSTFLFIMRITVRGTVIVKGTITYITRITVKVYLSVC